MDSRLKLALPAIIGIAAGCGESTAPRNEGPLRVETAYDFPGLGTNFIMNFDMAPDGTLWVTSFEGTIFRVRQGQTTRFEGAIILGGAPVNDLFIDGAGRPWVTAGSALAFYDGNTWVRQELPDFMGMAPKVQQVALNPAGDVLLTVGDVDAGGLLLRRNGVWQVITPFNSPLQSPIAREIAVAPDGSFWVGAAMFQGRGGLTRISNGVVTGILTETNGLLYNWIDDIAFSNDRAWIAYEAPIYDVPGFADGGLQSMPLNGGQISTLFPAEAGLGSNRVRSVVVASSGEVWFTTGLDEDSSCQTCVSSVGVLGTDGAFTVISHINSSIAPNEFMPQIRQGPDGEIYVLRASQNDIIRVSR